VGWRLATEVAKRHDVWVITDKSNQRSIERHLSATHSQNPKFVFHDVAHFPARLRRTHLGIQLHYYLWQRTLRRLAATLHKEISFDVVHHTTWERYWMPSGLAELEVPFVWGPVGAAESVPAGFSKGMSARAKVFDHLRNAARRIAYLDPALRRTAIRASVVLVTTQATKERVLRLGARRVEQMPPVGFTEAELQYFGSLPDPDSSMFRAICIGRLLHWKGFHLAIQAFAHFHRKCTRSELWIVNDGPEKWRLEELAQHLGVSQAVRFWGKLPALEDVHSKLSMCQVLIHPALHESFGNVCTEAMASGRPVICLDIGGPATQVTLDSGYRVRPTSETCAIRDISEALEHLYEDPSLCVRLGRGARERVTAEFSSDALTTRLDFLYQRLASSARNAKLDPALASVPLENSTAIYENSNSSQ
jgi:glycosyltransferase involved in cell wall biosynthesis